MNDYQFSYDDLDSMINSAASDVDFSNYFSGSGQDFDFGSLDPNAFSLDNIDSMINDAALGLGDFDFSSLDLPQDFLSSASTEDIKGADLDALLESMGSQGIEGLEDVDLGDARVLADMAASTDSDFGSNVDLGSFEDIKQVDYLNDMFGTGGQNFGASVDMDKSAKEFDTNLTDIMQNRGGFTSQWQDVNGRKVEVRDDGTGVMVNPSTGASKSLSASEVTSLINAGKLNSAGSGYNAATGGNKTAPGGGTSVTLKDGTKGTLLTNGRVIDDNGTVIGKTTDVKTVTPPGATTPRVPTPTPKGGLGSLLPLLLALLAMNKGGGGGGGSKGAVIPGLTATQRQTPYAQQQRAPGYRPGQGGVNYFEQTQFAPRMAAGGGIGSLNRGRLLRGPGDGVSDSIPAVIGNGMAKGGQPAKLARGEYVIDARTVAALGNGSTDAGAERLDKMRKNILRDDRKAGVGKDSKAYRHLMA